MALVRSVKADPGTTRNAVIDLDLATVDRRGAAGALHAPRHRPAARARTGRRRTIVLNRTQGEDASADLRASEIRFTRFFNSTPMAIAGVDQQRPHPAHQRAVPVAVLLGRRPRRGRPARPPRHGHPRARPRRLRRGAGKGPAAAGRHRADRHACCPATRSGTSASTSTPSPTAPAARAPRRRRSSMPSRRPSRRRSRARWRRARRCRRSASSPAASRTTSTTC